MKTNKIIKTIGMSIVGIFGVSAFIIPTIVLTSCSTSEGYILNCSDCTVLVDKSQTLTPTLTLKGEIITKGVTYKYISDDTNVATVDNATANVKGIKAGSTSITIEAMTADKKTVASKAIKVTVEDITITLESDLESISYSTTGSTYANITATVDPESASNDITITASPEIPGIDFINNGNGKASIGLTSETEIYIDTPITITAKCGSASSSIEIMAHPTRKFKFAIMSEDHVTQMTQDPLIPQAIRFYCIFEPSGIDFPVTFRHDNPYFIPGLTFIDNEDNTQTVILEAGASVKDDASFLIWALCDNRESEKIWIDVKKNKINYF